MMRAIRILAAALVLGAATQTQASELTRVKTEKTVAQAMDALQAAVDAAGATVFARVDHAAGAAKVDMELTDSQVLIFGNPKLGTPAMQADPLAGLFLPLRVLAYADADGQVWLVYEDPAEMLEDLSIPKDAPVVGKMQGALKKLTGKAAGG